MNTSLGLCEICDSILAIGRCVDCRRAIDGVHGTVFPEGIICGECRSARAAEHEQKAQRAADEWRVRHEAELSAMPVVSYLVEVATGNIRSSQRAASGQQIAEALGALRPEGRSYDGNGALALGQVSPGIDKVLKANGELVRVHRGKRWHKESLVNPGAHVYGAGEVTSMLREGSTYIRAITSDNP